MVSAKKSISTRSRPLLGAHISAAGGLLFAIGRAAEMGAECMQIFGGSPHQWAAKLPAPEIAAQFKMGIKEHRIGAVFLHGAYLVNLASQIPDLRAKSVQSLTTHLKIADAIGANGLIFHMGGAQDREKGIRRTVEGIHEVLKNVPGKTQLVMENSAGGGMKLGGVIADLEAIFKGAASNRLKVCIDTAHTFGAGLIDSFSKGEVTKLIDNLDAAVGIENVVAMHINDSKAAAHTHIDRHENLGHGKIGLSGFQNLANEKRLSHIAWMLEVPGMAGTGPDKENLDILKGLFN